MTTYILRRLLLMIPTLFGIMVINFLIVQSAPGGPVEQMIFQLENHQGAGSVLGGSGGDFASGGNAQYRGSQGLAPEVIAKIEALYGFDKADR